MTTAIVWFRQDLRLLDNPALYYAALENNNVILLYIFDESIAWAPGKAQQWWLHHSLLALQEQCKKLGLQLVLRRGKPEVILTKLCKEKNLTAVYWNHCYEPAAIQRDKYINKKLTALGVTVKNFKANVLFEPWEIKNKQGGYFKIFTPFWKQCCSQVIDTKILPLPTLKQTIFLDSESLATWQLLPTQPDWADGLRHTWQVGELAAQKQLRYFISTHLHDYGNYRDFPGKQATSRLSPYLHFGEISVKQIWRAIQLAAAQDVNLTHACEQFLRQLGWREFSYYLLYHFPHFADENYQKKFDAFSWSQNKKLLSSWQKGQTGYPLVDAGMRELWYSGYMHNRVRMIVASFLTKHLLLDWRHGAQWFWDTLVDADLANNSMGWQWVAGSGVDAAPYYRIFNPILQGEKFDAQGDYIRQWLPELAPLSNDYLHQPWKTPQKILQSTGIVLDRDYPLPIVEHVFARQRALDRYKKIK